MRVAGGRVTGRVETLAADFGPREAPAQRFALAASGDLRRDALRDLHLRIDGDSTHVFATGTCGAPDSVRPFAGTDLAVGFAPLAARDVRRYFPSSVDPGDVTVDARLRGDGSLLIAHVEARGTRGARLDLDARATPTFSGPVVLWARGEVTRSTGEPGPGALRASWSSRERSTRTCTAPRSIASTDLSTWRSMARGWAVIALERARGSARFAAGRAALHVEARSEGLVLQASGAAQPFADPPTWELAPALTIPARTAGGAPPRAGERALVAGTLSSEVKLRGRSFADWVGTVALALHPESAHDPLLGDGRVDVTFDGGAARLKAALDVAGGRVSASGRSRAARGRDRLMRSTRAR